MLHHEITKLHSNHVTVKGHHIIRIPVRSMDDLCKLLRSMKGKENTIVFIPVRESSRAVFKEVASISNLRHNKKYYRQFLYETGYMAVYCVLGIVSLELSCGVRSNKGDEFLEVSFD